MLKIDRAQKSFSLLDTPKLVDVSITERYDLQEFIFNSHNEFFKEFGQDLFLIGKEIKPSSDIQDRIDLLALDKEGNGVIVELKRGSHKLQMLQAISYAGMISQWVPDDFLQCLDDDQKEELRNFLEEDDLDNINRKQRVILIAEAYDYALLMGAEWLYEKYRVDIICCRIAIAKDSVTNSEYLVCSNVYPAPELAEEAVSRGRKHMERSNSKWSDWDAALANVTNNAVVSYFQHELEGNRQSYLPKRVLRYQIGGKRRFSVTARKNFAYIWQRGRFDDDIEFWRGGLSRPDDLEPVKKGASLRMRLYTEDDFHFFQNALVQSLKSRKWLGGMSGSEEDELEA